MTLEEYAIERSRDEIIKAKEDGMSVINALVQHLMNDGRLDDLKKSTEDKEYQEKLIKEYGLED